ncbi:signal transduction histidine-protein kinase BarA [Saccharicrinis fermentans DSM 9555 = JCM 21142]|uniref:histidine kinase n=1 Tax=Saccharicrinis fermentans DSM 9555 = JCM 21142 TaxID=869213 RepID=W7YCX6_9BACT|nr:signal transduction histidine-protein kinase BarA [Saccharicrinis fermentans DSM 9555 = JCM 21142]
MLLSCLEVQGEKITNILLLHSYHTGYEWTDQLTQGVINGMQPKHKTRVFVEYMDYKRFQNKGFFYELENLYKYKYSDIALDGIICADNYAFDFFLKKGDHIWNKNIPVVVCGVNNIHQLKYNQNRIKGVKEELDVRNTLNAIFQLQPSIDSLVVISDQTLSGKIFLQQFLDVLSQYKPQQPYIILDGSNYNDFKKRLKNIIPERKAIVLLSLYTDKYKIPVEIKHVGEELLKDIHIPIYSFWDFLLGDFIVGGSLISSYDQGYDAAHILKKRIENPNQHIENLMDTKYRLKFDFNLIKRYKLNEQHLPSNAVFENKTIPSYIKFKKQLLYFLSALIILIIIILFLMTNIIKRKNIELKLIESEERLELALNGANEGLWDIQLRSRNMIYNNNFATLLGYRSSRELKIDISNWRKLFKPDDLPQIKEALILHLKGIEPIFKLEIQMYTKNGTLRYFSISGKITERDLNDKPLRLTGIIMEISSQKEFEAQLKIAKERAEESDRLKSSFLANMSHEIRTPMNAILGFSDILMCHELKEDEKSNYLSQIKNSGETLLHLINDIVDLSKIESGQLMIRKEKFDLHKILNNIQFAGNSLIKAGNKSISLIVDKESNTPTNYIYSDPFRLQQIILNLISNAVKFTHEGEIVLMYKQNKNHILTISVSDTGEGISPEDQAIIFDRFRQAEKTTKKLLSGTGLGLSISKSLIHLLGGEIYVESDLNNGSTFTFTIPTI